MPNKSIVSLCWGQKEAVRRPKQRETVPVTKAAAPAVLECQPRECVNCNRKAFRGTIICENCNRPIREVVVVEEMLAAAVELMEKPEAVAGDKKFFCKKEAASSHDLLLAYDDRCRQHRDEKTLGSFLGSAHPERPDRVGAIMARLYETGLLKRCKRYTGRDATREELLAVHDVALLVAVEQATKVAVLESERAKTSWYGSLDVQLEALQQGSKHIRDVYFNPNTAACARLAAGSAAEVARRVVSGSARHGAAIIRPPGHHAESSVSMGFCYFNNAAVAARAAQAAGAPRIVIMDWDVHHGNGTQSIFYDDPSVLYMSTHRYDHSCFYPGSGGSRETGSGPGTGFTVNVPWNGSGVCDADMLAAFRHVILPIAAEFRPDLVIVSAGFDAAEGDPLGGCRVTTAGFSHLAALLSSLAPCVLLLEGGYNLLATAAATEGCLRVLLGEKPMQLPLQDGGPANLQVMAGAGAPPPLGEKAATDPWVHAGLEGVSESALESVCATLREHSEFWEAARKHLVAVEAAMKVRQRQRGMLTVVPPPAWPQSPPPPLPLQQQELEQQQPEQPQKSEQ